MEIAAALKADGWVWLPCSVIGGNALLPRPPDSRPSSCITVADHVEIDVPPAFSALGDALGDAIREPGEIGMADVRVVKTVDAIKITEIIVGAKR